MPDRSETTPRPRKPWYRSDVAQWVLLLAVIVTARSSLANHYTIPSGSMEPTLMPGDRVLVDLTAYGVSLPFTHIDVIPGKTPVRGDVVVFPSPANGIRLIKRVVAVGGDTVSVTDGHLTVNGQPQAVDATHERLGAHGSFALNLDKGGGPDLKETVVPAGKVLMMGDARGNSMDGRFFGWVDQNMIYGKATRLFYRSGEGFGWQPL